MNAPQVALPTVGALLAQPGLGLTWVPDAALPASALETPAPWVHSSDLWDPTPFLVEGVVLLTTGTQFEAAPESAWLPYVTRLVERGVAALGFGTEVIRDGIPEPLIAACSEAGLPLFEVPFKTPFIAVARANAEAVTALAFARRSWALGAQRAIASAALVTNGLLATVQELSRQMQAWVGLFDVAGSLQYESLPRGTRPGDLEAVEERARQLLHRQSRAASVLRLDGQAYTLQTVGPRLGLRGVLAVAVEQLDHEAQAVMNSVVAMVGLASEQDATLLSARLSLRTGLYGLLKAGSIELAQSVAAAVGGVPRSPVIVAKGTDIDASPKAVAAWIASLPRGVGQDLFLARDEGDVVLVAHEARAQEVLQELLRRFGGRWGASQPGEYEDFAERAAQAEAALARGSGPLTRFGDVVGLDLIGSVADEHARTAARAVLKPLMDHDERHGTDLLNTLAAWLRHDGKHEETARELGVHRHTIRARLKTAEHVGGYTLETFPVRAELWAALTLAGLTGGTGPTGTRD